MNSFFFKSLQHLLVLLTISITGVVWAQIQESPLDTQILPVGQMFSLIIKGDGESNPPARITAEGLPPESVFLRNLDGSRTFIWIPDESDQGTSSFLVTIADGNDASLAATYPINLEVVASVQRSAEEKNLADSQTDSTTAATTIAEAAADTGGSATGALDPAQLHAAEVVDIDKPAIDSGAAPTTAAAGSTPDADSTAVGTTSDASPDIGSLSEVTAAAAAPVIDSALAVESSSAPDSDALVSEPEDDPVTGTGTNTVTGNPKLVLPEGLTAVVNEELSIPIRHSSGSGSPSQLRAMNLPKGAVLSEAPDGHILSWTPGHSDTGSTAIILIATDAGNPLLSTTRRLGIEVLAQ